ncbi:MAG: hypothetical protein WCK14_13715 [Actinomycetota bacterium]
MSTSDNTQALLTLMQALGVDPAELLALMNSGNTGGVTPSVSVNDFVNNSVMDSLSKGQRTTWASYLRLFMNGYADLCACFCDTCLDSFAGNSLWQPCQCVVAGSCSCTVKDLTSGEVHATSCLEHCAGLGDMELRNVKKTDLAKMANWAQVRAQKRTKQRNRARAKGGKATYRHDGRSALELFRAAMSCVYTLAIDNEVPGVTRNLGLTLAVKARPDVVARSYSDEQLEQLWQALFTCGGDDTELDMFLVWFLLETGSRRGGPIGLRVGDLLVNSMKVRLSEKNGKVDEQPVSPALMIALLSHALERGDIIVANPLGLSIDEITMEHIVTKQVTLRTDAAVFYYKKRLPSATSPDPQPRPLTVRRFDTLWGRLRNDLAWLDEFHGRPHDLRKTSATFIERACGHAVAKKWLRHSLKGVTDLYTASGTAEVEHAHRLLIGGT